MMPSHGSFWSFGPGTPFDPFLEFPVPWMVRQMTSAEDYPDHVDDAEQLLRAVLTRHHIERTPIAGRYVTTQNLPGFLPAIQIR